MTELPVFCARSSVFMIYALADILITVCLSYGSSKRVVLNLWLAVTYLTYLWQKSPVVSPLHRYTYILTSIFVLVYVLWIWVPRRHAFSVPVWIRYKSSWTICLGQIFQLVVRFLALWGIATYFDIRTWIFINIYCIVKTLSGIREQNCGDL